MKKPILTLILFAAAPLLPYVAAQNTGFGGKRVVLKTEVLHGTKAAFTGIAAEVAVTRGFTISAGFRKFSSKYRQRYIEDDFADRVKTSPCNKAYEGMTMPDKAEVASQNQYIELRFYKTGNGLAPAPKGGFTYLSYGWGKADVDGHFSNRLTENLYINHTGGCRPEETYSYRADGIRTQAFEFGWGYQGFLTPWLTLELRAGMNATRFNHDQQYDPTITSGIAKSYGPNIARTNLYLFTAGDKPVTHSFGLSGNVQVGFMLF